MENLGIDFKLLLAQVINFVLFFIVFRKFIAKPFLHFIQEEKRKEKEKEKMLYDLEHKHEEMVAEEKEWKQNLIQEREKIIEDTKKAAEDVRQDIVAQAKKEATEMVNKAKKHIDDERQSLFDEVRTKTIDLSIFIINSALKDYLTEDVKKNLTSHIIKNLSKDVSQYEN